MSTIANSIFSPELAARFDKLVTIYPVKRSALIPMLLYAQDEVGYVSEAVIQEIAKRLDLFDLDVRIGAELLLHAADQAGGQVQHPGLHEHQLHVARRVRDSGPLQEEAGHRA